LADALGWLAVHQLVAKALRHAATTRPLRVVATPPSSGSEVRAALT
jgi:hypothetical protein